MKSVIKCLKITSFSLIVFMSMTVAYAYTFDKLSIKKAQGYTDLPAGTLTKNTNWGGVVLTSMTPDAVTFSVRGKNSDGEWDSYGSGVVYEKVDLNKTFIVPYKQSYTKNTNVQARVRNHNWSLNSNTISGEYIYTK